MKANRKNLKLNLKQGLFQDLGFHENSIDRFDLSLFSNSYRLRLPNLSIDFSYNQDPVLKGLKLVDHPMRGIDAHNTPGTHKFRTLERAVKQQNHTKGHSHNFPSYYLLLQ